MKESFFLIFGLILFPLLVFYLFRIIALRKKSVEERAKAPDLDFVINSFQDMVTRLRENEEELKRLRRKAEDRAEEIETYTDDVLRSVTSGVITIDNQKKIVTFNRAAEDILSFTSGEAISMSCGQLFGPAGRVSQMVEDVMADPIPCRRTEIPFTKRNGDDIWIGMTVSPLRNRRGALIGTILVFSDLTEIKLLKEQVEMREKMTVLGEMSAGIAHELRNPMGVIAGYTELLAKKTRKDSPNQEIITGILEEISCMNRIITEFLAFARPADMNMAQVVLADLVKNVLNSFEKQSKTTSISIKTNFPEHLPVIMADDLLLRQAFQNLAQNAIDALPEMGGELEVTAKVIKPFIEIRVRDNGTGIPREKIGKIFTPFFTTKEKGTGLGLALVQKIIVYHGGKIEVNSQPGVGTTFHVFLPINTEEKRGMEL